ncbi:MAG: hypothetical protein U9R75_05245 [Candidatus Thermoplasmatota archaeon]|nr:hypothetical protein [Candidatus Thermoplasmatota archaeon]
MGGKKGIGPIISLFTLSTFIFILSAGNVSSNPLPMDQFSDGYSGCSPTPSNTGQIYFKEEVIKVRLHLDHAEVSAEYIFENSGNASETVEIVLPFMNDVWDMKIYDDLGSIDFDGGIYHYEPLLNSFKYYLEGQHTFFGSINFRLEIEPGEERSVFVEYGAKVSCYDSSLNSEVTYSFSYLVGTGRFWNHSIEKANFEFTMNEDLFDRVPSDEWTREKGDGDVVFNKEFNDWIPYQDTISISWEKDRGFLEETGRILSNSWNNDEERVLLISCCSVSLAVVLIPLILWILIKKRKKRKGT